MAPARRRSMSDTEIASPEFAADPYRSYRRWREQAPAWRSEQLDAWLISRYDDVRRGFADHRTFAQSRAFDGALKEAFGVDPIVQLDPPDHREVRRMFSPYYRPRVLEQQMAGVVTAAVAELVGQLEPGVPFELRRTLGRPLTMRVMAWMIGSDNSDELDRHYRAVLAFLGDVRLKRVDAERAEAGRAAGTALMTYLRDLRRERQPAPGLNLIAEVPEEPAVDEDVVIASFANILLAGVENTVGAIATTVYALATHPEQAARVKADPSLAARAFDEAIRWVSPVQMTGKVIAAPVEIGGCKLEPGDEVLLVEGSANRDPDAWSEPDGFDVARLTGSSVAFGTGVHVCLGAPLARLEAATLLEQLYRSFPDVALDPSQPEPEFDGAPLLRMPRELWLVP